METRAVNIRKEQYDVYCGRPKGNEKFHYGNPFSHNTRSKAVVILPSIKACIEAFRNWLNGTAYQEIEPERRKWILDHLPELKGKRLACWCKPSPCHVDVYVEMIENTESKIDKKESPGQILMNDANVKLDEIKYAGLGVRFNQPTVICLGKYRNGETARAYEGSLSGNYRYIKKWGVSIYDPSNEKNREWTTRMYDEKLQQVFIFEITGTKLFENKREMRKFLQTINVSPFINVDEI